MTFLRPAAGFAVVLLALGGCGCGALDGGSGTGSDPMPEGRPATDVTKLHLLEAVATLDRVTAPEEGSPDPDDEIYLLTTLCSLRLVNSSALPVLVDSLYGSPFDDFELVIQDEHGRTLARTSHVLLQEPDFEVQVHELPEGISVIQLVCHTPVAREAPVRGAPFIHSDLLTAGLRMYFEGGFPGSALDGKVRSNTVDVAIIDRTGGVPDTGLPRDPLRQADLVPL